MAEIFACFHDSGITASSINFLNNIVRGLLTGVWFLSTNMDEVDLDPGILMGSVCVDNCHYFALINFFINKWFSKLPFWKF